MAGDAAFFFVSGFPIAQPVFDQPGKILFLGCRIEIGEFDQERAKVGVVVEFVFEQEVDPLVGLGSFWPLGWRLPVGLFAGSRLAVVDGWLRFGWVRYQGCCCQIGLEGKKVQGTENSREDCARLNIHLLQKNAVR